jgi:hypothetical protein
MLRSGVHFHNNVYNKSQREGWQAALADFMAARVGVPDIPYPRDLNERVAGNMDFFFTHEYMTFVHYVPDLDRISKNKVQMVAAIATQSPEAYYVQSTKALAAKLACDCIEFPGHHDVSFYMPEELRTHLGVR